MVKTRTVARLLLLLVAVGLREERRRVFVWPPPMGKAAARVGEAGVRAKQEQVFCESALILQQM